MATRSSILAWRIPWTSSLAGYSPWGCKKSDMTESLSTARHSHLHYIGGGHGSVLQYSCLENPMDRGAGGLLSIGLQRIGQNRSDLTLCNHHHYRVLKQFHHPSPHTKSLVPIYIKSLLPPVPGNH